ncbi:GtrA family protein [Rhodoblastus acidophilus]|uniref:GtrA family protein n=1 Tax=Candidatus Rhodoblastus alkanivorans TaxID=2954117 RepID=A0ABS9Z506_9HYPH|nr:GtrA family protein [Candidatus Rhodoblastus alkanivorans]MCI4677717.1 GtrA family protein [Candidatus Rhodoblastus alkanivorans]MCI4682551.1 GtrA family protein [Candidatus Rhodoblastus alkanivorans]MDI4639857.1 GtrA family protein [Rhodoblastus acidophilus]
MSLRRQFSSFFIVGSIATATHYSVLISLKELAHWRVIPATLCGFCLGGLVSYVLNRRHTFASDRAHVEAGWRFFTVSAVGFFLTWGLMRLFVVEWHAPYLPAQMVTTGLVMFWNFGANRQWTFRPQSACPAIGTRH